MEHIDEEFMMNAYQKMLVHSDKSKSIMEFMQGKKKYDDKLPISMELHLTNRCNLKCEWCVDRQIRENKDQITWEALENLVQDIAWQGIGLTIEGGGEPTLYPRFEEFIKMCSNNGIKIGLISNGVKRLPIEVIRCFDWIRISLDSTNEAEYITEKGVNCFQCVVDNIKYIAKEVPNVVLSIGYVVTKRNYQSLGHLFDLFKEVNIGHYRIRTVEEHPELLLDSHEVEKLNKWIKEEEKKRNIVVNLSISPDLCEANNHLACVAHSLRALIHADGNVVLCEKRRHDMITLGNINHQKFREIWNSDLHSQVSKKLLDVESQKGCAICRVTKFNQIFEDINKLNTTNFI